VDIPFSKLGIVTLILQDCPLPPSGCWLQDHIISLGNLGQPLSSDIVMRTKEISKHLLTSNELG
jgi:hypothetical protein